MDFVARVRVVVDVPFQHEVPDTTGMPNPTDNPDLDADQLAKERAKAEKNAAQVSRARESAAKEAEKKIADKVAGQLDGCDVIETTVEEVREA